MTQSKDQEAPMLRPALDEVIAEIDKMMGRVLWLLQQHGF